MSLQRRDCIPPAFAREGDPWWSTATWRDCNHNPRIIWANCWPASDQTLHLGVRRVAFSSRHTWEHKLFHSRQPFSCWNMSPFGVKNYQLLEESNNDEVDNQLIVAHRYSRTRFNFYLLAMSLTINLLFTVIFFTHSNRRDGQEGVSKFGAILLKLSSCSSLNLIFM